jgi:hypothetical protein
MKKIIKKRIYKFITTQPIDRTYIALAESEDDLKGKYNNGEFDETEETEGDPTEMLLVDVDDSEPEEMMQITAYIDCPVDPLKCSHRLEGEGCGKCPKGAKWVEI